MSRPASRKPAAFTRGNSPATASPRVPVLTRSFAIDALRGFAICLMVVYHFSFDLNYFGFIRQDFYHNPFWLGFRGLIVSLFLFTVGLSLSFARRAPDARHRFRRRLVRIAACAALVTLGSYLMFPQRFIYFGILHFIVLASVLAWPLVNLGGWNLAIGIAALLAGNLIRHPLFDPPWLNWIGMMTHKPATEDYVPLLPWFGVVVLGLYAGELLRQLDLARLDVISPRAMAWLGRHSLVIYMLHQPILIGVVWLARHA